MPILKLAATVILLTTGVCAYAQSAYPAKPIQVLNNAGGAPEGVQRAIFEVVRENTGAHLVMLPKPGGGGALALQALKAAAPDGYTFAITYASAINLNPLINRNLGIDPLRDFVPVSNLFRGGNVFAARSDSSMKDIRDLVAAAKEKPGTVRVGIWGAGNRATMAQLEEATGAQFLLVPYKTSSDMLGAIMGGFLDVYFETVGTTIANTQLKALAYGGPQASKQLPGAPLIRDLYKFDTLSWWGVLAPAGTPPVAVEWMSRELARAVKSPKIQKMIESNGFESAGTTGPAFAQELKEELRVNEDIVRKYPDVR